VSISRKIFDIFLKLFEKILSIFGEGKKASILANIHENLLPVKKLKIENNELLFYCPGVIPLWRADTLLTKEPETIEWIDTFDEDDIFWDVGANIGVYSLYAALRLSKVVAFEPAAVNYYLLNRNIEINNMDNKISALCIAFGNVSCLESFHMSNTDYGGALHSFSEAIDWQGNPFTPIFEQSILGFSIDDFIKQFKPPFPTHIKIDVDGIENRIIEGAQRTISNDKLKSLLVELDTNMDGYRELIRFIEKNGMKLWKREHAFEVEVSEYSSVYNHIFVRNGSRDNRHS